jgi:hypothetical protein
MCVCVFVFQGQRYFYSTNNDIYFIILIFLTKKTEHVFK